MAILSLLQLQAANTGLVPLSDSIKTVDAVSSTGTTNARHAVISSNTLTTVEGSTVIEFEVALKMRNLEELQARIAKGNRISASEMAAKYEPLPLDYQLITDWVTRQGFTITRRDSHHMVVFIQGTVDTISAGLQVNFARVSMEGKSYTSAVTAPSVPLEIFPLLVGINGLQPHLQAHKHLASPSNQGRPNANPGSQSYFPAQISQAYGATGLYNSNVYGAGQSIAIVIDTFPSTTDLVSFWQNGNINQSISRMHFIQAVAGQLPATTGEETLDVEWSSAMAPSSHVRVYATTDLGNAHLDQGYQQVYDDVTNHPELGIHQMSMSYGIGETDTTNAQVQTDDQFFAELAAAGVTVFASAGDDGSTPGLNPGDIGPLQAESPASDPNVTGVGGTTLVLGSGNSVTSESVWNNGSGIGATGGGTSVYFNRPSWQTGTGISGTKRLVPDVASAADPDFGGVCYFNGSQTVFGGTSWSSPMWAGFCALINQARADAGLSPIGILGPNIYPLLGTGNYLVNFRDITSGNNATSGSGGLYNAKTGYDEATGVGAPKLQALTQTILGSATIAGVVMPAQLQAVNPGQNASFTVGVNGSPATYQWQRMPVGSTTWSNLSDNATYGGSLTSVLTINNATIAMSGDQFQCIVHLSASTVTTTPSSVLTVDDPYITATVAGLTGVAGITNGSALASRFNFPSGLAVDSAGNVFIADFSNNEIRELTPGGVVFNAYGNVNGTAGSANGSGNNAQFNTPNGLAIDSSNNIYVADTGNNLIRKITSGGAVTTLAGTAAHFSSPDGVAVDTAGNVYVADTGNDTIRKITPTGLVTTLAGRTGVTGHVDGPGTTTALFNSPTSVVVDSANNIYVADYLNEVIRKITPAGAVSTIAGQAGVAGYRDGPGGTAQFNGPIGLAIDASDNLYVADSLVPIGDSNATGNNLVRKITPAGVVSTLVGQAGVAGSNNGVGSNAQFNGLQAIAVNSVGTLYIADTFNQTIRTAVVNVPTRYITVHGNMTYGTVPVGSFLNHTLNITNPGNTTLTVSSIDFPPGYSGDWNSGTIPAGGTQSVQVTFTPPAVGSFTGSIVVNSDAMSGTNTIAVSGTGAILQTRVVTLTGNLAFGTQTIKTTSTATLNIANFGNASLTVTNITFPTGFKGDWTSGSVPAGGSQNITVTFAPTAVTTYGGNIVFYTNSTSGTTFIAASGTGIPAPVVPVATTSAATGISSSAATLNATVNPKYYATSIAFQYGTTTGYGTSTPSQNVGAGSANLTVPTSLTGLASQTIYHYRIVATNIAGTTFGKDVVFTTLATPTIGATATASVGGTGTIVNQTLNPNGISTLVYFQYGTTTGYGSQTTSQGTSGKVTLTIFGQLPDLTANTTYHFRMVTTSAAGTFFGPDQTFVSAPSTTTPVAVKGDSAVGSGGSVFATFGNPAISDFDNVAFLGTLTPGFLGVTTANNTAIWADDNTATRQLIVRTGTTLAPGTSSATYATLSDPVYNNNEEVAFRGVLKVVSGQATSTTAAGVWSTSSEALALVARQGTQAPDCPAGATFSGFTALGLPDQGGVLLLATLNANTAAGVTAANNQGIWAGNSTSDLQLLVRLGDAPTGKTITKLTFLPTVTYVNGETRSFAPATGDIIYGATFSDKTTGLIKMIGGVSQAVISSLAPADGVAGAQFAVFGNPTLNNAGHTAFAATLVTGPGGVTTSNNSGIWADDGGGTRQLIARTGTTLAPGTANATFATLSDPAYNSNNAVAFRATLKVVTGQATSTTATGIWANNSGTLTLIARQGSQAPGCPAGATFNALTAFALPDQAGVLLLATLNVNTAAGVSATNNTGIWAVDTGGNLQLVARVGDTINGKKITALSFLPAPAYVNGQARSFSQGVGDISYLATFSDKSTGIFKVIFP